MFKVESRWGHQDTIKVEWNLGKRCNYDCSYCPSVIHDNTSPHTDLLTLRQAVDNLVTLEKPIRLSLTGGEPTTHPEFDKLLNYCKEMGIVWINVTTNGTRKPKYYCSLNCDHYVYSLHFEYDWERVLYTIIEVHNKSDKTVMTNVMAHHEQMKECKFVVEKLKENKVPFVIRRIRWTEDDHDKFDDNKYAENDLQYILNNIATVQPNCIIDENLLYHSNDIIKLHLNQYKNWHCSAGLESLMINYDGEVYRATCRVGGSMGNIYNGTFIKPIDNVVCTRSFCTCASDIPLTKVKV
jgi:MoaA/NifB/PqqE/SkfB family radical SAM enzyme